MTTKPTRNVLRLSCLCLLAWPGCDSQEQGDPADLEDYYGPQIEREALDAEVTFLPGLQNCTDSQKQKIRAGAVIALNRIRHPQMLDCLIDAQLNGEISDAPEEIIVRMREDTHTYVSCSDDVPRPNAPAWTYSFLPYENITFSTAYLNESTSGAIAGVILHEVAHNKGYEHHDSDDPNIDSLAYGMTVLEQLHKCTISMNESVWPPRPRGTPRSAHRPETELQPIGGSGGSPFSLSCDPFDFVDGLRINSHARVNSVELRCRAPYTDERTYSGRVGGSGGYSANRTCGQGELAVGLWGRATPSVISALGIRCQSEADVFARRESGWVSTRSGDGPGDTWVRECPPGMAIRSIEGRSGSLVDRLRIVCQEVDAEEVSGERYLPRVGTSRGATRREVHRCIGRTVLRGLDGNSGTEVDRLGGMCRSIAPADLDGDGDEQITPAYLIQEGGWGGGAFQDSCDTDQALVGMRFRAGGRIDRVQGLCANIDEWISTGVRNGIDLPARGGSGGVARERMCSWPELLVGWQIGIGTCNQYDDETVHYINPICRDARPLLHSDMGLIDSRQNMPLQYATARVGDELGDWDFDYNDEIVGAGNFDGQGGDELLLRSSEGLGILTHDGGELTSLTTVRNGDRLMWWYLADSDTVEGVGDFDGDGRDDFILQRGNEVLGIVTHRYGTRFGVFTKEYSCASDSCEPDDWFRRDHFSISGIGDFDGNGTDDLIVHNDRRVVFVTLNDQDMLVPMFSWEATNMPHQLRARRLVPGAVVGVGDFNADGAQELILQGADGIGVIGLVEDPYQQGEPYPVTIRTLAVVSSSQPMGTWTYTSDNLIAGVGNFDGLDGDELLIRGRNQNHGLAIIEVIDDGNGPASFATMAAYRGVRYDGWMLVSADRIVSIGNFDGDRAHEIVIQSGVGVSIVEYDPGSWKPIPRIRQVTSRRYGQPFGDWTLAPTNTFGPTLDMDGDGRTDMTIFRASAH